jgi:hypothetical protein
MLGYAVRLGLDLQKGLLGQTPQSMTVAHVQRHRH